jgi:cytosine/uracil/thiamine/allantoin permease
MTIANERRLADGRVELIDPRRVEASPLYNDDLAPVPLARRTWTTYNYAALWVSMAHCIPTYMLASGLMAHQTRMAVITSTNGAAQFSTSRTRSIPR